MLRVVFDTVVFIRSLINPHSTYGDLVFAYYRRYRLFLSRPVLTEILEVLRRPELTRKYRRLRELDTRRVIDILKQAEVVNVGEIPTVSRDPKDDKFLATARAAGAQYLVSEDKDLLDLEEYEGVKIVDVATFLRILKQRERGEE